MTEVPEHLLRRSRERKAQASGEAGAEAGAPATEAAASSSAVEPAAGGAAPAAAGGGGTPAKPKAPEFTGPPQPPKRNPRLPLWAMPVVAALPFWAMLYAGSFGERPTGEQGPIERGAAIYTGQGCGGCHGPTGGGGIGPAMAGVAETFPEFADHVEWVRVGSAGVRGQPYGATGKIATGGMPGFDLPEEDLIAVVCHERVTLGGAEIPPECEADASPDAEADAGADNAEGTAQNQDASGGG